MMMTTQKARSLKNSLVKDVMPLAIAAAKGVVTSDTAPTPESVDKVREELAQTVTQAVLKMNSGATAELLSFFIANQAMTDAGMLMAQKKLLSEVMRQMDQQLGENDGGEYPPPSPEDMEGDNP